ncbi:hypothetical protein [Providencia manganoxydans]|uniref:hypothetical protein n=1 Tax=Providencia manganoxydans TaxID=2923283 RepID=UPI0032DB5282
MNKYTELSDFEINKKVAEYTLPTGDWYVINKKPEILLVALGLVGSTRAINTMMQCLSL